MKFVRQLGYNVAFFLVFMFLWPYFTYRLWKRGHIMSDFWQRLGFYPPETKEKLQQGCDMWIHAVSVGEVMLAKVLLQRLREKVPGMRIVISTTTATGQRVAKKLEDDLTTIVYNPTDFLWSVRQAFETFKPKRLVLIEAEIWPNYIWCAKRRQIPIYLVNARLSARTESRFNRFRFFCRPVLQEIDLVFAQDTNDVGRLTRAGFASETIFSLGSLKYDVADVSESDQKAIDSWWPYCGWTSENLILLGGSTHSGEEAILANIYHDLKMQIPNLRLILAPRHAERGNEVKEISEKLGFNTVLRSDLTPESASAQPIDVLVLNTTGELKALYPKATVVFVGKSLTARGGQNFIEAARLGAPIVVGPNMQNFSNQANEFVQQHALIQVNDEFELSQKIRELFASPEQRKELGQRGLSTFRKNLGAGRKTAEIIIKSFQQSSAKNGSHS